MDEQKSRNKNEEELINIQWTAPEFEKREKSTAWFLAVGIFALVFFTIALLMKNLVFAILILLAVFAIFIYAVKDPRPVSFQITSNGIAIDDKLYRFEDLNSFWIFFTPPSLKELSVKSKKIFLPMIKIPLTDQNPVTIRQTLIKFIPEEKQEESLVDIISRSIGF